MSSFPADIAIWILLFAGIVFLGIGIMGLLLFPDTRSRMFTAFRATAIGTGAVAVSVLIYAATLFATTGGSQYPALILRTLVAGAIVAAGLSILYRKIRANTRTG